MRVPDELDDVGLLRAIAQGSEAAFGCLYERHAGRLMGYALRALGERTQAEELVQDVFVAVWLKASSYRPELGTPLTWMYMIARHKRVDRWRRGRPGPPLELERERASEAAGPELALTLERALDGLRPEQRQAVEFSLLRGYTHEEAAHALHVPLGTLKSRVRLALLHLRGLLTE